MKILKMLKFVGILVYVLAAIVSIGIVGITITSVFVGDLVTDVYLINSISLAIALLSLPGIFTTMIDIIPTKKKARKYNFEGQCPYCYKTMNYYYEEK